MLYFNGLDATTGAYARPPVAFDRLQPDRVELEPDKTELSRFWQTHKETRGLPMGIKPEDVPQSGWGVVFAEDEDPAVKDALDALVVHRKAEVVDGRHHVLTYPSTPDGEEPLSATDWLARRRVGRGNVLPTRVPYYLLVVGSPERIPFSFTEGLRVEYAVGRLDLDTPEDYARYAQSVVDYETGAAEKRAREAVFFGTRHPGDEATKTSADHLIRTLTSGTHEADLRDYISGPVAAKYGFQGRRVWRDEADKDALLGLLHPADRPPAFLFTASHGLDWPAGVPDQPRKQGALLCDWPGLPGWPPGQAIPDDVYLTPDDVRDDAQVHGLIAFLFACHSAGTPVYDRFVMDAPPQKIADRPFLAPLPKRLLAHPAGGALACIGHIDRALVYSIAPDGVGPQLVPFHNAVSRILLGHPVGCALRDFVDRYNGLNNEVARMRTRAEQGNPPDLDELAVTVKQRNDAEGYLVLGDPAVRLRPENLD